jgi:hypothetical protein
MVLREVLSGEGAMDATIVGHVLSIFEIVREMVQQGVREGSFRPVDPLLTHLSYAGSLIFMLATQPFRKRAHPRLEEAVDPPTLEAFVRHHHELITRGLLSRPAGFPGRKKTGRHP